MHELFFFLKWTEFRASLHFLRLKESESGTKEEWIVFTEQSTPDQWPSFS